MADMEVEMMKDVPGYMVILKAVIKSQIQQLVEQLAVHTDEETIVLTASVADGTLSHLGSKSGKGFLDNNEDIKSQFLGYCLKSKHRLVCQNNQETGCRQIHPSTAEHVTSSLKPVFAEEHSYSSNHFTRSSRIRQKPYAHGRTPDRKSLNTEQRNESMLSKPFVCSGDAESLSEVQVTVCDHNTEIKVERLDNFDDAFTFKETSKAKYDEMFAKEISELGSKDTREVDSETGKISYINPQSFSEISSRCTNCPQGVVSSSCLANLDGHTNIESQKRLESDVEIIQEEDDTTVKVEEVSESELEIEITDVKSLETQAKQKSNQSMDMTFDPQVIVSGPRDGTTVLTPSYGITQQSHIALKKMPETLRCFELDVLWDLQEYEMDSSDMDSETLELGEREYDITKEDEINIDRIVDRSESENEINSNRKNGDRSENEINSNKVKMSEGESAISENNERKSMKRDVDRKNREMDSNEVEVSEGESEDERNTGRNSGDNSENDMDSDQVLVDKSGGDTVAPKESEILRDTNYPGIYIRKILKSFTSSKAQRARKVVGNDRVYNSYHACFFCGELKSHVKIHIERHEKEPQAAKYIGKSGIFEPSVKAKLLRKGDHKHNCKVIQDELGEIILARRPIRLLDVTKFGPCPECQEWILLKNIKVHYVKCSEKSKKPRVSKRRLIIQSQVLGGFISNKPSKLMIGEVFPSITRDKIGSIAKSDPLIIALGEKWLRKRIDNREKRKIYTSGHMRLMARLLIELRKRDKAPNADTKELSFYLRPAYFDLLLHAAIECCTPYMDDIEDIKSPSNALKLKYDVERIVSLRWAMLVIEDPHSEVAKEMDVLQRFLSLDWADRITELSMSVLVKCQISLTKHLPSPQEVECLTKHVVKQLGEVRLAGCNFFRIVQLAETRLLTYNKMCSGEIQTLRVASYAGRTSDLDDIDESLMDDLTKVEKYLLKSHELMKVTGKSSRPAAVILPGDTKKALAFISRSDIRENVGIPSSNTYLFPNAAGSFTPAYDSLKRISKECYLRNPSRITSIRMRTYTATLTQLLNLPKHEVEWLCKRWGHSADIYKTFYQQMSSLEERVYISKLLLVQEFNLTHRYKTYFDGYLQAKICPSRKEVDKIMSLSKKKGGEIWKRSNDKIIKKISNMNHK